MKCYQIGIYEKAMPESFSLREMLLLGKEAGYDFFEISIDRTEKRIGRLYDKNFYKTLKNDMIETDFFIGSMCLSALGTYTLGSEDPSIEDKAVDIFYHAIDFAEYLGLRIVQIPACDVPKNGKHTIETDLRFIRNLKKLIEYASAHSVVVGLENMEDGYMDDVEKSMRLVSEIDSPYFLLYPDSGNITSASKLYGTDIRTDMMKGKNRYCAFHLKETKPDKYGGLFYGDGDVDFEGIMKIAWEELSIHRFVLEYWYTGNPLWKDDLIKAHQLCENWINTVVTKGKI